MKRGISEHSRQLHRHPLNHNTLDVMNWMQESGMANPVGMIVAMTDDIGKQLTYAARGRTRHCRVRHQKHWCYRVFGG